MTEEAKKELLEEFLPQMTCELLLHLKFFNQVIEDGKQSSELVENAKTLLASNHGALIMLRALAESLGGEGGNEEEERKGIVFDKADARLSILVCTTEMM